MTLGMCSLPAEDHEVEMMLIADLTIILHTCDTADKLWLCVITDNDDRTKKITIAIRPVGQNCKDSAGNFIQGVHLSPPLQVTAYAVC